MSDFVKVVAGGTAEMVNVTTDGDLVMVNVTQAEGPWVQGTGDGGVSSWNDLTDRPAALLNQPAANVEGIRKIGTGATDAMAGNATPTPAAHTHPSSAITDLATASVGTSAALVFGDTVHAVSMSYIDDKATFTYGSSAAHAMRYALVVAPEGDADNYTLTPANHGRLTRLTQTGGTATITIPQDGTLGFALGHIEYFRRHGTAALAFSISGVTVNGNILTSIAQNGTFALVRVAADTWDFI